MTKIKKERNFMRFYLLIALSVITVLLSGCPDSTKTEIKDLALYLTINDSLSGKPIADADVNVYYVPGTTKDEPQYPNFNYPNPFTNTTIIQFDVEKASPCTITVNDGITDAIVYTVHKGSLQAGTYAFQIPLFDTTNGTSADGFYICKVDLDGAVKKYEMLYLNKHRYSFILSPTDYQAVEILHTDANGLVKIPYSLLPWMSKIYKKTLENGQVMGNVLIKEEIGLVIRKGGVSSVTYDRTMSIPINKTVTKDTTIAIGHS
jgi:hypothetical protein